ncbi:hypothetical protein I6E85_11530 [Pseudoalteromonas sp. NZS71]|uniref:hypothetical protein n=1 Tax=unclassified Pseudoalteromonas TaxID=194690 RepID=UPI0003FFAA5B|nr:MULTISPECIES: hypothetical protein [unclassified Pseudoalteromonas]MBH0061788.1 hypothetical protein [Pseudoalteromonas sp. NZS71]
MSTVNIIYAGESTVCNINEVTLTIENGENEIPIDFWIGFKSSSSGKRKIDRGAIYPKDVSAESVAISDFKELCFSEFDLLGVPAVKVSLESGSFSKGVKHSIALEWMKSKSEIREVSREDREKESLSISRKALLTSEDANSIARDALSNSREANKLARRAIIWSAIATLIAVISIYFK